MVDPSLFTLPYDLALAAGLKAAGHQVTLHGRQLRPYEARSDAATPLDDFYSFAESRPVALLPPFAKLIVKGLDHSWSMIRLLSRLRRAKPDIIHFQWLPLPLVDSAILGQFRRIAPLILTVHDTEPFNGDQTHDVQRRGFNRSLGMFDTLLVHTEQGRNRIVARGVPAASVRRVPHGLLTAVQPDTPSSVDGPLTFLLFGKIKSYKGTHVLIEAFARLAASLRSQARVRVVGKPYMDIAPLQALAASLGVADRIAFEPRFVDEEEVGVLFGPGTVAVFPYLEIEASGVMSLAIAHGRPIIASDRGGFSDTLIDGVHGHLVPANDVPALADALAHVIADRAFAASCARNTLALARATPSWAAIGAMTADIYGAARSGRKRDS